MKPIHLFIYLLALGWAGSAFAQSTPAEIIDRLGLATRPHTSGNWDTQRAAEAAAAEQLRALIKTAPGQPALTETDALGRTPLMRAAVNGYADVVGALLGDAGVRASIETRDFFGATAWSLSQFARPVTLLSCHPQMLVMERAALWRPYLQRSDYFLKRDVNRFQYIGQLLVAAGAQADQQAAKAAWKAQCPGQDDDTRTQLDATPHLLRGLMLDTHERLERLNRKAQKASSTPPTNPEPPLLAWPGTAEVWQQRWPRLMRPQPDRPVLPGAITAVPCTRLGPPNFPHVNWSGAALFRVIAEIQAGVPTVAEIRLIDGLMDHRAQALIQIAILRSLATYECAGDHIFEQEFRFKAE